jgi:hypothetical protein
MASAQMVLAPSVQGEGKATSSGRMGRERVYPNGEGVVWRDKRRGLCLIKEAHL